MSLSLVVGPEEGAAVGAIVVRRLAGVDAVGHTSARPATAENCETRSTIDTFRGICIGLEVKEERRKAPDFEGTIRPYSPNAYEEGHQMRLGGGLVCDFGAYLFLARGARPHRRLRAQLGHDNCKS